MARPWDDILSEQDRAVLEQSGYNERGATLYDSRAMGERPVLLVIDMQRLIVADDVPILDAVKDGRIAIGEKAHRAVERMAPFVALCREVGVPVIHMRIVPDGRDPDDPQLAIVEPLAPAPGERVIDKQFPSAFFGTPLLPHLVRTKTDTVMMIGNSTSGCIRATAIDARQHGFHVVVPEDYVFDRIEASHKIGLLDLWMKIAAVITTDEAHAYVNGLREEREKIEAMP